ncbi:MAG: single-stranded-DNA-specific exonuclease RecJ [Clostridia bacterium]|nr:single-stranded-DNA-specific exonuclease RecJ [Clostridia bacterium]
MAMKRWLLAKTDKELAKSLAEECDIDAFTALIAASRGYTDAAALEEFLSDEPNVSDYRELADVEKAASVVNEAIERDDLIAVYGDYDCDGITATALLVDYLRGRGARVIYYIPDRILEGYGMHEESVKALYDKGVNTIITVDNGIAAVKEIELANSLGMTVVVTDHHLPQEVLPNAAAVVDPHRVDCPSTFKNICGVAVAFKLVCAMEEKPAEQLLPRYADLVGIGTVGDVMPLTGDNRSIVKMCLRVLKYSKKLRKGISALLQISGVSRDAVTSEKIAFSIVPRINAAGRMGDAKRAVELLLSEDIKDALTVSDTLDRENGARQEKERKIFAEAVKIIENNGYNYQRVIVVQGENWHSGVVGIVAGKLCEFYGKPAIVLTVENDLAFGSGRSFNGFELFDAVNFASDLTVQFGGHALACGVTLKTENIDAFRHKVNDFAEKMGERAVPALELDCRLNPAALGISLAENIKALEPFGMGNPQPVFALCNVVLNRITPIANGKHLRLLFSKESSSFQCLLFGVTQDKFPFSEGDTLDLAVTLDINLFGGEENLSVFVKGIRLSDLKEEEYFKCQALYDKLKIGKTADFSPINPTRDEVGIVYKTVMQGTISAERLKQKLYPALSHFKTQVAIDALLELSLLNGVEADDVLKLSTVKNAPKTDLMNAQILRRVGENNA